MNDHNEPVTVTSEGMQEIREILTARHKQGAEIVESSDMMAAWASEAESHHDETGEAYIEIGRFEAVSGHTETYTIEGIA
jgi:hypothetical protein